MSGDAAGMRDGHVVEVKLGWMLQRFVIKTIILKDGFTP